MSSQESEFYLDGGDDLVVAFLEQEIQTKQEQRGPGTKRSRTRSVSPDRFNPHAMGLKVDTVDKGSDLKRRKVSRSPSIEVLEVRKTNKAKKEKKESAIKREPVSSSPIVIVEPPVAWPPSKMPASEAIKEAHATHRKHMVSSSSSPSSSRIGTPRTHIKQEQQQQQAKIVSIYPSLTESSQKTLNCRLDEFDDDMKPVKKRKAGPPKLKKKKNDEAEAIVARDEKGNLTERGKRALNKRLLESLGQEENAITNSDLYSR
jgi:hypothetical protein